METKLASIKWSYRSWVMFKVYHYFLCLYLVAGNHYSTRKATVGGQENRAATTGRGLESAAGRARGVFAGGLHCLQLFCLLFRRISTTSPRVMTKYLGVDGWRSFKISAF